MLNFAPVGKRKLQRFAELKTLDRVFEPDGLFIEKEYHLKGKWCSEVFGNRNPLVLELGCGKGEYTVNLARRYHGKNFIGVDIKGARIWRGAKTINDEEIKNAAFLRTHIEHISSFFGDGEISEIWITFPDPQPQQSRESKRLTSAGFLKMYDPMLVQGGSVHLKTDSRELYEYTLEVLKDASMEMHEHTGDLYASDVNDDVKDIKTTYEKRFLEEGKQICYIRFGFRA
jgi:tRNA (guanine-N7-)-methyltransferase